MIENLIIKKGDIVQFLEHNFEYLLLKFAGISLRNPSDFDNLSEFRPYCKREFQKKFNKPASDFKDPDFDSIFNNVSDEEIRNCFSKLFSTLDF